MYDELVKRLREIASWDWNGGDGEYVNRAVKEAADAIEDLSKQILEMGQVGKFLLDVHKINSKMVDPESVPTDSEWWSHYKALLELLYLPRWIPVTERLPEKSGLYLVYAHGDVTDMHYWHGKWHMFGDDYTKTVSHWMPLPEPPKES